MVTLVKILLVALSTVMDCCSKLVTELGLSVKVGDSGGIVSQSKWVMELSVKVGNNSGLSVKSDNRFGMLSHTWWQWWNHQSWCQWWDCQ